MLDQDITDLTHLVRLCFAIKWLEADARCNADTREDMMASADAQHEAKPLEDATEITEADVRIGVTREDFRKDLLGA